VGLSYEAPEAGACAVTLSEMDERTEESGWRASLTLHFDKRGDKTVLARSTHFGPLRVQRPFYPEPHGACHVYVLHPPGGVASGDRLRTETVLDADAHALVTTPGAAKLYRSSGTDAHVEQHMQLAQGALLEWLPQETIVFEGAEAQLTTHVELAEGAVYAGWEIVCLGRPACGEGFLRGRLQTALRVSRAGRLRFVERGDFRGGDDVLSQPWGLGGAPVFGLFVLADERADPDWVEQVRQAVQSEAGLFAVSLVSGVLTGRYLGHSTLDARASFERMFAALRPLYAKRAAVTPRIWRT
jgi:urease accessory protein